MLQRYSFCVAASGLRHGQQSRYIFRLPFTALCSLELAWHARLTRGVKCMTSFRAVQGLHGIPMQGRLASQTPRQSWQQAVWT